MKNKIGLFGGSFDPIHSAHLILASVIQNEFGLEKIFFIPNYVSPFKKEKAVTDISHRIEMIRLAIAGNNSFFLSDFEAAQNRPVYTYETLQHFRSIYPDSSISLIIGVDSLLTLRNWKNSNYIISNAEIIVAGRNGSDPEKVSGISYKLSRFCPEIGISSTLIREMAANNLNIKYLVNDDVRHYIIEKKLYCKT
ncbi:MAG TPA: nicotinate (nicotinamide) nucleotide adenylyltransferase [Clostridiales bacterium]|jgi:nicotinate-nucleotide adenylyltransferase|nr:nicotinate (nicotinamide) nucleotide adenylyltransferase [Clostridiales bacterium]HQP69411.1 nicotinate (nicotinamide) nucleotide adenylyltransferase [Clostridiales bacterium]